MSLKTRDSSEAESLVERKVLIERKTELVKLLPERESFLREDEFNRELSPQLNPSFKLHFSKNTSLRAGRVPKVSQSLLNRVAFMLILERFRKASVLLLIKIEMSELKEDSVILFGWILEVFERSRLTKFCV